MPVSILLSLAILAEVVATVALRFAQGLSRPLPLAAVVVGYGLSFWLLSLILRDLSMGFVYAVWSGAGTALIAGLGILLFGETATMLKFASLALIVGGVIGLNLAGGAH
jgi:small multidrug resistance pump